MKWDDLSTQIIAAIVAAAILGVWAKRASVGPWLSGNPWASIGIAGLISLAISLAVSLLRPGPAPDGIPKHAIIALDDPDTCAGLGSAWEDAGYGGKFVIGADKTKTYGERNEFSPSVILKGENMPQIFLGIDNRNFGDNTTALHPKSIGFTNPGGNFLVGGSASPTPVAVPLPPYVALYFCRKKT